MSSRTRRNRRNRPAEKQPAGPTSAGLQGGRYAPLDQTELVQIDKAIRHVLTQIGFAEAPAFVVEQIVAHGGSLGADQRLRLPEALLDKFLQGAQRHFKLHGQQPGHELHLSGQKVYVGSGGAAPQVVDLESGRYRDSTLQDLYDAARLVDSLEHIHFFSRSLVARDMPDDFLLDINTAYACLAGTQKHICTSISHPDHVKAIADICFNIAGSPAAFQAAPFLSLNINHVVPPLRLDEASCAVMAEAARFGLPIHANAFGQVGASSPVTPAGSVVQNVAEALFGMLFAWLINPKAKTILGSRPMITDLRTGGMAGGGGEQALVMAATAQMAAYYDLPNSSIAGATDSKIPDAQSGYEKGLAVTLAAQAGSNMVTQACGMQAGLMSVAFESYIIDNDMLGAIMRTLAPLEVNPITLATQMISEVVHGEGHFLGHPETYNRMQTDFLYPQIADRRSPQDWEDAGARPIRDVARDKARHLLGSYFPTHIGDEIDHSLREKFDIRLPLSAMRSKDQV